jgi:hypothetical protein
MGEEVIKAAFMALCAEVIATTLKEAPSRREKLATDFSDYVAINKKERQRQELLLRKRLQRRMIAARMSLGFVADILDAVVVCRYQ